MSPRPKKATDDEIFTATTRVMSRLGPHEVTLADIAAEAGLTASALVQRFGSKRALLLTLSERFAHAAGPLFAGAARRRPLTASHDLRLRPTAWRRWANHLTRSPTTCHGCSKT